MGGLSPMMEGGLMVVWADCFRIDRRPGVIQGRAHNHFVFIEGFAGPDPTEPGCESTPELMRWHYGSLLDRLVGRPVRTDRFSSFRSRRTQQGRASFSPLSNKYVLYIK